MRLPRCFALMAAIATTTVCVDAGAATAREASGELSAPAASPYTATYVRGALTLQLPGDRKKPILVARWPVDEVAGNGNGHGYRAARLELLDAEAPAEETREAPRPVPVRGRAEWEQLVGDVMTALAPKGEDEAALTVVQDDEIVFWLSSDGQLQVRRHEDKPASRRVTRAVSEGEFAARADTLLRERYPTQDLLLYETGSEDDDLSFVFFDLAHGESVLVTAPSAAQGGGLGSMVRLLMRVPDTLLLRGQALGVLTRPVSSAARLAWFATQTIATIAPPVHLPSGPPPPVAARPGMDPASWERELDAMNLPRRYQGTITPLIDGEAFFTSLVQAVQDAKRDISIRLFIFDNDDYALRFAELLKRRSRGVRVRVLLDALGTLGASQGAPPGAASDPTTSIVSYLREHSKVEVRQTPNTWLVADHTKTLIVDDRIAYVGGMNIGHEYRHDWHDMMVGLTGPIVGRLQHDFEVAWAYAGLGGDLAYLGAIGHNEDYDGPPQSPGYVELRPLYTRTLDPQVLRAQIAAIRHAQRVIWVEQPYVSDDALVRELIEARARGVDVRMILPSSGDSRFMNSANLLTARALVKAGVRVYVYPGMTHVKAALYDGWACLGSANFDKLSMRVNRETNIATSDATFVGRLRQELFEADFARSRELAKAPSMGWGTYISAFVAGQL